MKTAYKNYLALAVAAITALVPVLAFAISAPDSISVPSGKVVRDVIANGDEAFFFEINLHYSSSYPTPPPTATDAILVRLYGTDGTTLLSSTMPFSYFNNGWGLNVVEFYFSPSTVTALGISWNDADTLNIIGSPAYFSSFTPANYTLQNADYSSTTDKAANQIILHDWVIAVAKQIGSQNAVVLQGSSDNGDVLTAVGDTYFQGALPGLSSLCPQLFLTQFYVPTPTAPAYNTNLSDTYSHRLDGTDIQVGLKRLGNALGVSGQFVVAFFFLGLCIAAVVFSQRKLGGPEPGVFVGGLLMTLGALLFGSSMMTLRILMAFIAGGLVIYMMTYKKA